MEYNHGETDGLGATPVNENPETKIITDPAEAAVKDHATQDRTNVPARNEMIATKIMEESQEIIDALGKLKDNELMLGLRCPCGHSMMAIVEAEFFETGNARTIATNLVAQFIPVLANHIELLAERIVRVEQLRAKVPGGKGVPTIDEVVKDYHNEPCPLRRVKIAEQDVPTIESSAPHDTSAMRGEPPVPA